mmetsp:Transcript_39581/g.65304  ORF Transcript_39581/g.65304 Transcript_39581/m.65304 type:complete len:374 (-) Transcript_39581:278-1399(-)
MAIMASLVIRPIIASTGRSKNLITFKRNVSTFRDFRSDTVTAPSAAMRQCIQQAAVGDDVFGDDPTVKHLEAYAAELLGKNAAMFVPSGTMSNLIAVGTHCQRSTEVILGHDAHIFRYEGGGASAFMGVSFCTLPNQPDGTISIQDIEKNIRPDDPHCPRTSLICLEDTHNLCGGVPLPPSFPLKVAGLCQTKGLKLHLDGARLANAAIALHIDMKTLCQPYDSVSLCLSKGLGAPVGSILAGEEDFIQKARYLRKALGGGMRQSGMLAAGGLYALQNNFERLEQDHSNAKRLATEISTLPGVSLLPETVKTNIVYFDISSMSAGMFVSKMKQQGILIGGYGTSKVRAVTSLQVNEDDVQAFISTTKNILESG